MERNVELVGRPGVAERRAEPRELLASRKADEGIRDQTVVAEVKEHLDALREAVADKSKETKGRRSASPLTVREGNAMIPAMATALFVAGLVLTLVGVVLVLLARAKPPPPPATESFGDVSKVLEEFRKVLELIDKQYRIGVIVMAVGLALVGTGAWLEARDAKDAAAAAGSVGLPRS